MPQSIVVKNGGEGIYEEKKSRFIAKVYSVSTEQEANEYIEAARKKYWDARHNCYAFIIGANSEVTRCSDDGEPSGTAGKPILEVISGTGVYNCLVIVTRYFGGTLLGTGGLVRAYTKACKDALEDSALARVVSGEEYMVVVDYSFVGKIQRIAEDMNATITNTEYLEKVSFTIQIEAGSSIEKKIIEGTNGKATVTKNCDLLIEIPI
jgi:uncharacterized YigZ family protein